jgi:hypothetical protein
MKKLKPQQKQGQKDTFAIASSEGTGEKGIGKKNGEQRKEFPAVKRIGGVPASIVARVSAAVAATGVDLLLPVRSYARVMEDRKGNPVNEIAFGRVGNQSIGCDDEGIGNHRNETCDSQHSPNEEVCSDTVIDGKKLMTNRTSSSIMNSTISSVKGMPQPTCISKRKKRSHEEFIQGAIPSRVIHELTYLHTKMDRMEAPKMLTRNHNLDQPSQLENVDIIGEKEGCNKTPSDSKLDSNIHPMPDGLHEMISKDIALYEYLAIAIKEIAKHLAHVRKSKENS